MRKVSVLSLLLLSASKSWAMADKTPAPEPVPSEKLELNPPLQMKLEAAPGPVKPARPGEEDAIRDFCNEVTGLYARNKWGKEDICSKVPFKIFGWSSSNRPLLYFESGEPESKKLTIIQCGIHGDELPAMPMCLNLISEILSGKKSVPKEKRLVIQPLLNPDGMFKTKPTRTNGRGVDVNRNFPTKDWSKKAIRAWKIKESSNPRKYPGSKAKSESETEAIVNFIDSEKPQKIISIHTPLGFLDLDAKGGADKARRAKFLAINMSKNSGNYTFRTFGFYPGSLGNYAGQERGIPVYTLELPPGESASTVDSYWKKFRIALWRAIEFDIDTGHFVED